MWYAPYAPSRRSDNSDYSSRIVNPFSPRMARQFYRRAIKGVRAARLHQNDFIQRGLGSTVPTLFASRDLDVSGTFYHGRILQDPVVDQGFFDSFFGVSRVTTVSFRSRECRQRTRHASHGRSPRDDALADPLRRGDRNERHRVHGKVSTTSLGDGWVEIGPCPGPLCLRDAGPARDGDGGGLHE